MWLARELAKEFSGTQPQCSQLTSRSRFQTKILLLYLNQFYKTEQAVGSSPNRNSCYIVSSTLFNFLTKLCYLHHSQYHTQFTVHIIIIIIITLFQEGDIYITVVNHDGPQNNRNNITIEIKGKKKKLKKNIYILCKKLH